MNLQLNDKVVFISGSTSGIGLAVARMLLCEGAHVIINGRSASKVEEVLADLRQEYRSAVVAGFACDFCSKKDVDRLIACLPDLDILINNVGVFSSLSFFDTSDDDWRNMTDVNLMSGVRLSRHFLPEMLRKNWGRIVFVSSECAYLVPSDLIAYSTTKAAVLSLSRGLAQLTKGTGVTVNAVLPGSTLSEGAQVFLTEMAHRRGISIEEAQSEFFANDRSSSLLQRFATVEEIAQSIVYYASPLSAATNGAAIRLDGGSIGGVF